MNKNEKKMKMVCIAIYNNNVFSSIINIFLFYIAISSPVDFITNIILYNNDQCCILQKKKTFRSNFQSILFSSKPIQLLLNCR